MPDLPFIGEGLELQGELVDTVDARHLFEYLGIGTDFNTWFDTIVAAFGFIKYEDYGGSETCPGGVPLHGYWMTLNMAREICSRLSTHKGAIAYMYFNTHYVKQREALRL